MGTKERCSKGPKVDVEKVDAVHYLRGVLVSGVKVVVLEMKRGYVLQPLGVLTKTQA